MLFWIAKDVCLSKKTPNLKLLNTKGQILKHFPDEICFNSNLVSFKLIGLLTQWNAVEGE